MIYCDCLGSQATIVNKKFLNKNFKMPINTDKLEAAGKKDVDVGAKGIRQLQTNVTDIANIMKVFNQICISNL